jgi:tryptophanyl-tRNA synthetase
MNKNLIESAKEYKEKLLLKKKIEKYCQKESIKNGLNDLEKIKKYLPERLLFKHLRRNIVIAHLDFEKVLSEIMKTGKFTVVSGLNPSSGLHYGHKLLFDLLLELQNIGADVFIPITNDETYLDSKSNSLNGSRDIALKEIIPSTIALGFNSKRTHIFVDTEYPDIYKFAIKISKYVSTTDVNKLFGKEALNNPGQVFYRGCVQLAQILLPQLPEFGGPKLTLIPVGIDQHPYVLLARDVAKKMGLIPPAELVIKFQPSLINPEKKMSKSDPTTAIFLSDNKVIIKEKIQKAYTGTVSSREGHNKFGGVLEICTVFALLNNQCQDDKLVLKLYKDYKNGSLMASELKNIVGEILIDINEKYQQKLRQVSQKKINQFILNKKLVSVYNP